MTAVVGELEAASVVDTEPVAPRRKRARGLSIWIAATLIVTAFLVLFPGVIAPGSPTAITASERLQPPSTDHLFGTDEAGRDLFTRIVHGARPSLGSAIIVVAAAATIGTMFGAAAGWRGGRLDRFAMRLVDVFLSFPYLVLAMAVASSMERGMRAAIIALVIVWWPGYARLVRGMVLSLKSDLHVKAARTLGAGQLHVLRWHVIPHLRGPLMTRATLDVGYVLLAIAGLSFLGLAAQNPSPEWGLTIANSKTFVLGAWWYGVFPGLVIGVVVLNTVLLGDRLAVDGHRGG
jgi:peptide/nickel transport system permease protein